MISLGTIMALLLKYCAISILHLHLRECAPASQPDLQIDSEKRFDPPS